MHSATLFLGPHLASKQTIFFYAFLISCISSIFSTFMQNISLHNQNFSELFNFRVSHFPNL